MKLQEARERKEDRTDTAMRVQKRDDARKAVRVGLKKLREQGEVKDWRQLLEKLVEARTSEDSENVKKSRLDFERASRGDPALVDLVAVCKNLKAADSASQVRTGVGDAAGKLQRALEAAVIQKPDQSAFGGLSVFYYPRAQQDRNVSFIAPAIGRDERLYSRLALSKLKAWAKIALEQREGSDFFVDPNQSASGAMLRNVTGVPIWGP